jgi:hypothetical protein
MFMVPYILVYVHVGLEVQLDAHGFICILYSSIFAVHVSGAICTHPQKHKRQSTATGTRNLWKAEVINSTKRCGVILIPFVTLCLPQTTHTYGCTLQFVLLMMGPTSTRNM